MASHISAMNTTLLPRRLRLRDPHGTSPAGEASSAVASLAVSRRTLPATIALNRSVNPVPAAKPSLASLWKEIQGSGDWEDMVEPLNLLLRNEIVRYGEFVLATYKAFDLDPASKRYLNCKYGKSNMLRESGFGDLGYEVTKYIYAAPDITLPTQSQPFGSRWIGYVAVSSDAEVARLGRRDIVVSFRGTVTTAEWLANFMNSLTPARLDPHNPRPDVKVQSGFLSVYTSGDSTCKFSHGSCREQLLSELSRIINMYKNEELSITLAGHSMGSSLALLLGYDLSELGLNRDASNRVIPTTVYSFGGPRVGNSGFKERCEELGVKVLRVVNVKDPVTKLPGVLLNENFRVLGGKFELPWSCSCYAHVGVELALDFFKMKDPVCVHDLDAYLGLLKCPKIARAQKNGSDLFDKAMRLMVAPGLDTCWNDAAKNVRNLVQSMRICDLTPWLQSR